MLHNWIRPRRQPEIGRIGGRVAYLSVQPCVSPLDIWNVTASLQHPLRRRRSLRSLVPTAHFRFVRQMCAVLQEKESRACKIINPTCTQWQSREFDGKQFSRESARIFPTISLQKCLPCNPLAGNRGENTKCCLAKCDFFSNDRRQQCVKCEIW